MEKTILGLIMIVVGGSLVAFRKKFTTSSLAFQKNSFGIPFGKKELQAGEVFAVIAGLLALVIGALKLLGVIK